MKLTRKMQCLFALMLLTFMLMMGASCFAETKTYEFNDISAKLSADLSDFPIILTQHNLADNSAYFEDKGIDPDSAILKFQEEGILLKAINEKEGEIFIVTAVQDVDAQMYFDLNEQDEEMRRHFRTSHTNGSAYSILGYDYSSSTWRNYGKNVDRFLRLKYTLKQNGQSFAGYQRRTIRNGHTITLDMQVSTRKASSSDEKFIDKMMSGFEFTDIRTAPPGACRLTLNDEPPRETGSETFTLSGKTDKGATVTAALISMTSSTTKTFSDVASSSGAYSMKVTFPQGDTYSLVVTSQTPDGRSAQQTFVTTYQRNLLPVNFTAPIPEQLTSDTLFIKGTTLSGAKTQISVTGPTTYDKTSTKSSFSFEIDTSKAGNYQITILVTKKGLETRSFTYNAIRTLTEAETYQRVKENAESVTYKTLVRDIPKYAGRTFAYKGYIIETQETGSEYTVKLALSKTGTTYKDIVYVISKTNPNYDIGTPVRMYGTLSESPYLEVLEGSGTSEYPRFNLVFFELDN